MSTMKTLVSPIGFEETEVYPVGGKKAITAIG